MKRQINCIKIDSIPYYEISEELKKELIEEGLKKKKVTPLSRLNRPTLKRIIFLPETDIPRRITSQVESIRRMFVPITLNCNDELPNECVEQKKDDKEYFEEEIINNELKSETQSMNDSFFDINISDMSDIDCSN